ncbi:cytochrome c oxidase assembly protein [Paracoccus sp. MBLB3053]|uniref:Cytochrome c oxidase assembly protein n=1 Tax=Paracoccus aurantius TaxID=3073814 RepID=A0ABU2HV06_9RHOB|nr:cytochrome c oxidase assembly protein [Paracoccus sp. MBLB3053]MDS9468888.1 cytochrome c oxidase assembly protein [Paracoccus sp. MBLB3053]
MTFRIAAALVLAILWLPDWPGVLGPFPGHMIRHMGLVAIAAPLVVLGWPFFSRIAPPVLAAAAFEAVIVWAAHMPLLHAASRQQGIALIVEQASFLVAGIAVWAGAWQRGGALAGAVGLLLTSMHMTLLGTILILAPRDLYAALCGTAPDLRGQQLGGIIMLGIGTPIYLLAGLSLTASALNERSA